MDGKYTLVEGKVVPSAQPDQGKLTDLTKDIASQQAQLEAAKQEDAQYSGGLVKALIGSRIATIENTIALLDQRRLAERYGIPYLLPEQAAGVQQKGSAPAPEMPAAEAAGPVPEPSTPCAMTIESFEIKPRADEYKRNFADLTLQVKNSGEKRVKAWRLGVRFDDPFGAPLLNVRLTDGTADLAPGASAKASFEFEDNQFIKDEPYDKLLNYAVANLKASIVTCDVSFAPSSDPPGPLPAGAMGAPEGDAHYRQICENLKPGESAEWCKEYGLPTSAPTRSSSSVESAPARVSTFSPRSAVSHSHEGSDGFFHCDPAYHSSAGECVADQPAQRPSSTSN